MQQSLLRLFRRQYLRARRSTRSAVNKGLSYLGYEIVRLKSLARGDNQNYQLSAAIAALLEHHEKLEVVIVGANDGVINDPTHPILARFPDRFRVLWIEPQPYLMPILRENCAFLQDGHFHLGAVGSSPGERTLYVVKPAYWKLIENPYGDEELQYRAPTGISSFDYERVYRWLLDHLKQARPEDAIEKAIVKTSQLSDILSENGFTQCPDVVVIDIEGAEIELLEDLMESRILPTALFFEYRHTRPRAFESIRDRLEAAGYFLVVDRHDALAIKCGR